jgi:acyl-homoserine lactone acylase PvdQ
VENTRNFAQNASADQLLPQLQMVVQELKTKFGTWKFLGDINRFQRLSGDINLDYDDSIVCLSAQLSLWGCLPAYKSVYQENTKKRYGNSGNSFVCVEFEIKLKLSLYYWGNSSDPKSKHFNDQSEMYQKGNSKTCFFTKKM